MSVNNTELGEWVDRVFADLFFQADDEVCNKTIRDDIDPQLAVRINGAAIPAELWLKQVVETRAQHSIALLSGREIVASRGSGKAGGTVGHMIKFLLTDRKTGAAREESSLTIATVVQKDGKRVMTELTEAFLTAEEA